MDIGSALTDMWRSVLLFVPKAIGFLVIMLVGWLIARGVRSLVQRLLQRVHFDRGVERGPVARAMAGSKYTPSMIVGLIAYWAVLLFTLQLGFGLWGPNPVSDLISGIVAWLPRAAIAIVIVVVAVAIGNAVRDLISNALSGLSYSRVLANVAFAFILGLGLIAALNQIGVATAITTPLLVATLATIGGILIVGVGGGLIRPMQQRWDRALNRVEQESSSIRDHVQAHAAGMRDTNEAFAGQAANEVTQTGERSAGR
jgi:hypothetical protein